MSFVTAQLANEVRAPWRLRIRATVDSIFFQTVVLVFIMLNFVFTVMELIKDDSAEWSEDFNTAAAIIYICEYLHFFPKVFMGTFRKSRRESFPSSVEGISLL